MGGDNTIGEEVVDNPTDGRSKKSDGKTSSSSSSGSSSKNKQMAGEGSSVGKPPSASRSSSSSSGNSSTYQTGKLLSDISNLLDKKLDNSISGLRKEIDDKINNLIHFENVNDENAYDHNIDNYENFAGPSGSVSVISDIDNLVDGLDANNLAQEPNPDGIDGPKEPDDDEIFNAVLQEFGGQDEVVGSKVNDTLANTVNTLFRKRLSEDTMNEKLKSIHRPANCDSFIVPRVNPLIWEKLQSETRSGDIKMQKIEKVLFKGTIGVVEVIDTLLKQKDPLSKTLGKKLTSSLAFTSHAMYELNMKRRELIKPDLNSQFKHLCSGHVPITDELFGDDLSKYVKDISDSQRVANKITRGKVNPRGAYSRAAPRGRPWRGGHGYRGARFQPYPYYGQQNFLWHQAGHPGPRNNKNSGKKTQDKNNN